jgi:hypothetical protein
VLGPYTSTTFNSDLASLGATFDRTDPLNPFADWNFAFIPYCTADVHAGDNIATYTSGSSSTTFFHKGHANALAFLARLEPTFPKPDKVVIVGDSAGGAGSTINYMSARQYWPNAEMYLINDSLPFYPPSEYPAATLSSELTNWGITPLLEQICGTACTSNFSLVNAGLRAQFPSDRMAYMGFNEDETMSAYYETLPQLFDVYLNQLMSQQYHPTSTQTYILNGTKHTTLWNWAAAETTTSVNLRTWVTDMVTDSPTWTSAGP